MGSTAPRGQPDIAAAWAVARWGAFARARRAGEPALVPAAGDAGGLGESGGVADAGGVVLDECQAHIGAGGSSRHIRDGDGYGAHSKPAAGVGDVVDVSANDVAVDPPNALRLVAAGAEFVVRNRAGGLGHWSRLPSGWGGGVGLAGRPLPPGLGRLAPCAACEEARSARVAAVPSGAAEGRRGPRAGSLFARRARGATLELRGRGDSPPEAVPPGAWPARP